MNSILVLYPFLIALLGLFFVGYAFRVFRAQRSGDVPHAAPVRVKIFGAEIHGGRPLVIFVIGVILVSSPVLILKDTPAEGKTVPTNTVPDQESKKFKTELPRPDYKGLRLLKDVRIIDLRSRRKIPKSKRNKNFSPVTWIRFTRLLKEIPGRKYVNFQFSTSGPDIQARSLTHKFQLLTHKDDHFHGRKNLRRTAQIQIDIENVPVNKEILIINEATYWNAFSGEKGDWAAIAGSDYTDEVSIIIMFPKKKPLKDYALYSYRHGANEEEKKAGRLFNQDINMSKKKLLFRWNIRSPKKGYAYQIDWKW